jgi:hypothetical protein
MKDQQMADFFATVLARATVMLIERLFAYLTQTFFVSTLDRRMQPA